MPDLAILLLTIVTIISVGLIGGVFFIFSVTIMRALSRIPAQGAISVMQEINIVIVRSLFLAAFFGAALTSLILGIYAVADWHRPGAPWLLSGSAIYLIGSILLTMLRNVPLNNELAAVAPTSPEGEAVWTRYLAEWTMWNHIRTVACIVATACFTMALADKL